MTGSMMLSSSSNRVHPQKIYVNAGRHTKNLVQKMSMRLWRLSLDMEMGFMAQYPAKIYAWRYMLANLPPWVMSLLVAAVFAGVVSSFAGCALAPATIFVEDIYKPYFKPDITQKQYNYVIRITVVVVVAMATAVAQYLPGVINGLNWLFA